MRRAATSVLGCVLLAGCSTTTPYQTPALTAPSQWPTGAAYKAAQPGAAGLSWRELVQDASLQDVIVRALAQNQNLRVTVANVAAARAQYRAQRSRQAPTLTAGIAGSASEQVDGPLDQRSYSASVGAANFEIDLFGRLRNLSEQAREQYLASESGARATRLALVAEAATTFLTLAADQDLLAVASDTAKAAEQSLGLTQTLLDAGLRSASDVENARTVLAQARSDLEDYTTYVAQDRNALELVMGGGLPDDLLPRSLNVLEGQISEAPAGLSSEVLRRRPDVQEAEHQLRGAYAGVGAAKAAFFPTITLTSAVGLASSALSSLLSSGAFTVSGSAYAGVPVLGGETRANLDLAQARRQAAEAVYQRTVQAAFRDVANALAREGTSDRQRQAQTDLVEAARRSVVLAEAQYRAGVQPYLAALTAQRTLYAARQSEVRTLLTDLVNRVRLYEALGADTTL